MLSLSLQPTVFLKFSKVKSIKICSIKYFYLLISKSYYFFKGAPHSFEKNLIRPAWSSDGSQIASGSGDRTVMIWDFSSRKILYKLPGHKGCVNEVDFHPKEPISKFP